MAIARARAFQEAKKKEEELKNIERIFQLKITKAGDAGKFRWRLMLKSLLTRFYVYSGYVVNFPKAGDQVAL